MDHIVEAYDLRIAKPVAQEARTGTLLRVRGVVPALLRGIAPAMGLVSTVILAAGSESGLEEIVVTGSRISRPDFATASPVVTLGSATFRSTTSTTVERVLTLLPQFVPTASSTSVEPANDGQANVSLRGIGVAQTLVLLDGRRMVGADGLGSVDVNVLPPALIESVEILSGGASAVYGSEAIAGVVNFKLRQSFEGTQFDGQWGRTAHGDGDEYAAGITTGTAFANGRGNVMAYVGYAERDEIGQTERDFSRYPLAYFADETEGLGPGGAFLGTGSVVTEEGIAVGVFATPEAVDDVFASYGYEPGTVPFFPPLFGINEDGTVFKIGDGETPGSVVNFRGEVEPAMRNDRLHTYNFAPDTALRTPLERTTVFARGSFQLTPFTEIYGQAMYADYTTQRQLGPVPVGPVLVPPTNPYLPDDLRTLLASRSNPDALFPYFKLMSPLGPRVGTNTRDMFQATAGVRGKLREWRYDAFAQFGMNDRTEHQTGNMLISKFQDLVSAPDGGASICGDFNVFGNHPISPDCLAYVGTDATNKVAVRQAIVEASISGPLFELPAGEIRAAAGLLHKRDEFDFDADPVSSAVLPEVPGVIGLGPRPDIAGFPASPDRRGEVRNTDLYVEALVPLLTNQPGARSLEVAVGWRNSLYTQSGSVHSYKGELLWQPAAPLRIRSSYQHAVRAPSVEELYFPQQSGQFDIDRPDPCSFDSTPRTGEFASQVEALCLAQGMPPELLPVYQYPLPRVDGVAGGNPDLEAESADTRTFGIVVTPDSQSPWLQNLQVSVDWYSIDFENAIGRWDSLTAVQRCYDPQYNPSFSIDNAYCRFFTREPESGDIFALIIDQNIGGIETAGIDLQVDWSIDTPLGRFQADEYLTYVEQWNAREPHGASTSYVGTIGSSLGRSLPRWKSLLALGYEWQWLAVHARWQHIDGMRDAHVPDFTLGARDYLDLGVQFSFRNALQGLTLGVGIENLGNENPPIYPVSQQANTEPSQYDVLGRRFYMNMSYSL